MRCSTSTTARVLASGLAAAFVAAAVWVAANLSAVASSHGPLPSVADSEPDGYPLPEDLLNRVRGKKHPFLLFRSITETPGWKNKGEQPWAAWHALAAGAVTLDVGAAVESLGLAANGMYGTERSGEEAMILAFAYLLTNDSAARARGIAALKRAGGLTAAGASKGGDGRVRGRLLIGFALAYDWLQPALAPADDRLIRDGLARLADTVVRDYPTWTNSHDRIIAGSGLGVLALALADYAPETSSGPVQWLTYATTHLFVKDAPNVKWPAGLGVEREVSGRSALAGTVNPGGYNQLGSYSIYWMPQLTSWLAVYHSALGRNPLDDFPLARRVVTTHLWSSMPNRMDSQQGTRDHQYYDWYRGLLGMLSPEERDGFNWYAERSPVDKLRERRTYGTLGPVFGFLIYDTSLPRAKRPWTSFVSPSAESVVLRSGWEWDSDWLFLNVLNYPGPSDRHMLHDDNLSFELYSRGDYLLSDSGEVKGRMRGYGPQYALAHNTLLIDGVGPVKHDSASRYVFVNPARLTTFALGPDFELVEAEMTMTHVERRPTWGTPPEGPDGEPQVTPNAKALDAPVTWRRTIVSPGKEYFVLIDHVRSRGAYTYEFPFHLSSLNTVKTDSIESPGHVIGTLSLGAERVDWAKDVTADVLTGDNPRRHIGDYPGSSDVTWRTTNLQGRRVELRLVSSVDAATVALGRVWGRVAVTIPPLAPLQAEVDHPSIGFRHTGGELTRMTAMLSRYADAETERVASRLPVKGKGSALKLEKDGVTDRVAAGEGPLEFDSVSTDARIAFVRTAGAGVRKAMLMQGRRLAYGGEQWISSGGVLAHAAFDFAEREIRGAVEAHGPTQLTIACDFVPASVRYVPRPPDWIWKWTNALEATYRSRPLPFRKDGARLVIDIPDGAGRIVVVSRRP